MAYRTISVLLILILHTTTSHAHSTGAPDTACSNLDPSPGHGPSTNSGPAPYTVTFSSPTYSPGQKIDVTLSGEKGATFKGFLIEAFPVGRPSPKAVGSFDVPAGARYKSVCSSSTGNGLTHTNPTSKSNLTFSWTAPTQPVGNIEFHFSVMRAEDPNGLSDYFKDLRSKVLTSVSPNGHVFQKDPECGKSKGCYSSCNSDDCDWLVSWQGEGDALRVSLVATFTSDNKYMAMGFSNKSAMFKASVIACRLHNGKVSAIASFNPNYLNTPLKDPTEDISDLQGSFDNGVLNCTFLRNKISQNKYIFNLTEPWYLITARSDVNSDGVIQMHDTLNRFHTTSRIDFMTSTDDHSFSDGTVTTTPNTPSPNPTHHVFQKDPECGKSKGCYSSCNSDDCDWLVSWQGQGDALRVSLVATFTSDNKYVAMGFSNRSAMFKASVIACRLHNGKVSAIASFNPNYQNTPLANPTEDISDLQGTFDNGVLNCTFSRNKISQNKYIFNLTEPWYLITTRSDVNSDGVIQMHDTLNRFHTTSRIDFMTSNDDLSFSDGTVTTTQNTPTHSSPSPPPAGKFKKDPACGQTKGCYSNCDDDLCDFLMSWKEVGKNYEITLKSSFGGSDDKYVAFGFSRAAKMYPACVVECVVYNGDVNATQSYNSGYSNQRDANDQESLSRMAGSFEDGILTCTFLRKTTSKDQHVFNLTEQYYLIAARGDVSGGYMTPHDINDRFFTTSKVLLSDPHVDISLEEETYVLIKLHGIFMIAAWILSASIGIAMARFFKPVWPDTTICGVKVWFFIHRTSMLLTFTLGVAGFIIIFVEIDGYSSDIIGEDYKKAHPILGIIVTALLVVNPFMSLLRCAPNHPQRVIFNWAHFLVGTSTHILSAITIAIGMYLPKARVDGGAALIVIIIYASWQLLFFCIMSALDYVSRDQSKITIFDQFKGTAKTQPVKTYLEMSSSQNYKTMNESTSTIPTKEPKTSSAKVWIMMIHVSILIAVAGYLIYMIIDADD